MPIFGHTCTTLVLKGLMKWNHLGVQIYDFVLSKFLLFRNYIMHNVYYSHVIVNGLISAALIFLSRNSRCKFYGVRTKVFLAI